MSSSESVDDYHNNNDRHNDLHQVTTILSYRCTRSPPVSRYELFSHALPFRKFTKVFIQMSDWSLYFFAFRFELSPTTVLSCLLYAYHDILCLIYYQIAKYDMASPLSLGNVLQPRQP